MKIMFKPKINFDLIFTFDGKDQEFRNCDLKIAMDTSEVDLIQSLIIEVMGASAHDLCKLSVSVSCKEKDYRKIPCIKSLLERGGKYHFQPNQRGEVGDAIIGNTIIARDTESFKERANG
jgi:hypothetical protein